MKKVKNILQHNANNFYFSVSMNNELYKRGKIGFSRLMWQILLSTLERLKIYHWMPVLIAVIFYIESF